MSHTRRWDVDNPNDQIRDANKDLHIRLMGIVTRRNLNAELPNGDRSSITELVDMLITNGVIPTEIITPLEFGNGTYTNAIGWFDTLLPDIER
jgi:hypothetical protein